MKNYGFFRVASAVPNVKVADCISNGEFILSMMKDAEGKGISIICFPELCITGYTCQDLFLQTPLISGAEKSVATLCEESKNLNITAIIGVPIRFNGSLYNCALSIHKGKILGIVPKIYLPNYKEFYEKRWFSNGDYLSDQTISYANQDCIPFSSKLVFSCNNGEDCVKYGIEICEDVWAPIPPSSHITLDGAEIIFNLSASNDLIGKHNYLRSILAQQSARTISAYIYSSCGYGESSQDVVFGGNALIYENGSLLSANQRFSMEPQVAMADIDIESIRNERCSNTTFAKSTQDYNEDICEVTYSQNIASISKISREVNPAPFVPSDQEEMRTRCEEIISIQSLGLARRIAQVNAKSVVVGVSGGLDSTLALLVGTKAMDLLGRSRKDIIGITMPCFGTTQRTKNNSLALMDQLGITSETIDIKDAVNQHFQDIGQDPNNHDVTYENCQARERTQVLMDYAGRTSGFVLGTGDLSELALGWCTYNADHMSMYNVNVSIPKTLVKYLVRYFSAAPGYEKSSKTLLDVLDTPVSPELLPPTADGKISQITEDNVGPYELHDFFLYNFMRKGFGPKKIYWLATQATFSTNYSKETIKKWLTTFFKRFFTQQFKRSCLPDGPKVGSVSLSPRGDWRMPSDATYRMYVKECEEIE